MIDTITPIGLNLAEKLHGHVRIETRDRWTGRVVDSQEKDNLVTNAIAKIFRASRGANLPLWNWFAPIHEKALGGLMLFDTTLTESADNCRFPGSAKLVGFAGQSSNTDDVMGGSLNTAESTLSSNSFATVWDFATSQANGSISSLARTSYSFPDTFIGGMIVNVYSNAYLGPYVWGNPMQVLGYDATNKYIYLALSVQQTYNSITYPTNKIYKAPCDFETQDLLSTYFIPNPNEWVEVVTVSSSTDGTNNAYNFTYDPYSNNFYYGQIGSTKKLRLIAMDGTRSTVTLPTNLSYLFSMVATENYYWYLMSSSSNVYRINKSNTADTSSATLNFVPLRLIALDDDAIMLSESNSSTAHAIVYSDLSIVHLDAYSAPSNRTVLASANSPGVGRPPMLIGDYFAIPVSLSSSYAGHPILNTSYLGTIANLDSPVTKSSSQTMKITYTLTEA